MNTTTYSSITSKIAFQMPIINPSTATVTGMGNPWEPKKGTSFDDLSLKPEYLENKIRFVEGDNWIRVVPALAGSKFEWMMAIHALGFTNGRFAHPKTLTPHAKCVFDEAYTWAKTNHPTGLYSKANKAGARLLSDPLSLSWIISIENDTPVLRLLVASGYNGSRGGTPGLGYRIWKEIIDHDTSKSAVPDAIHPETGVRICVNKTTVKGNPRPIYNVSVGRQVAPIIPLFNAMSDEEKSRITPLENVVRTLTEDEEWECLAKVMAPSTVERIRAEVAVA